MKNYLFLLVSLFLFFSCDLRKDDITPDNGNAEQLDFNLYDEINVDVTLPDDTRVMLFTTYPYDGDEMVAEPIMVAYAPFNKVVKVPKAVNKLYVHANGSVLEYPRENINLSSIETKSGAFAPASLRADDEEIPGSSTQVNFTDAFMTAINKFYPEALVNVFNDDLKTSSDLVAYKGVKTSVTGPDGVTVETEWGDTKVWITYVTNGGCNFSGSLWYYCYQVDGQGNPTTKFEDLEFVPIFEDATPANSKGKRIYLGQFTPGTRIGFKYLGNAVYSNKPYPKYSTPYYNAQAYAGQCDNTGKWSNNYNNSPISENCKDYKDNAYTAGVIRIWDYDGTEYATLGMENRLPSEPTWDGDFNDMICLIEATPLSVENTIDPPAPDPEVISWEGYWVFEDNYPDKGDYDFNDLVVKYAITEYEARETIINLQFISRGATFFNKFGINGTFYYENLQGYVNVRPDQTFEPQEVLQITMPKTGEYVPTLNNGQVTFDLNTFYDLNTNFPCVLDIPIVDGSKFQWPYEGVRIDDAYPRYKAWADSKCAVNTDWYLDTPKSGTTWDKGESVE